MNSIVLWKDRGNKIIDPMLFSDMAEKMAFKINEEGGGRANNKSQLRRFFDEAIRLNEIAQSRPNEWDDILPLVKMLTAKAAYARGRKLITDSFLELIKDGIKQVESKEDLDVFVKFFESFIGFYEYESTKRIRRR